MPTFPTLPCARKSGTAAVSGKVSANTSAIASSAAAALAPWKASPPSRSAMAPFDFSWVIGRQEPCAQVSSQARGRFAFSRPRVLEALDDRGKQQELNRSSCINDLKNCNNASPCSMPPGRRKRAPCTGLNTAAARRSQQGEQGRRDEEAAGLGAADAERDAVWKPTSGGAPDNSSLSHFAATTQPCRA